MFACNTIEFDILAMLVEEAGGRYSSAALHDVLIDALGRPFRRR